MPFKAMKSLISDESYLGQPAPANVKVAWFDKIILF
jgi:hypothetical protein